MTTVPRLTAREFGLFRDLIHREAGIHLGDSKQALLVGRLSRRLRELGLRSFTEYYHCVLEGGEAERTRLLDAICTNETHFFREPRQFALLEEEILPSWEDAARRGARARRARVWSAACSTGEEPYSLAMTLLARLPSGWDIEILASDLSTRVLDAARAGTWPLAKSAEIPAPYLKAFMLRGLAEHAGQMKAGPEIRSVVRFQRLNLNGETWPLTGVFDLVFCRNVLIYFDAAAKARVVRRLLDRLAPEGRLFLGHADSLIGLTDRTRLAGPTVYALRDLAPIGQAAP